MKNIQNSIYEKLVETIDPFILAQLIFFDHWKMPDGFMEWTVKQRRAYRQQHIINCDAPTKTNTWVWCGSFIGPNHTPQLNKLVVPRQLYLGLISGIPDGKYLRGTYVHHRADVNPYKYFPKVGLSRQQTAEEFVSRTGETPEKLMEEGVDLKLNADIARCVKEIEESFIEGENDSKSVMKGLMGTEFSGYVIDRAFDLISVKLKD